MNCSRQLCNQCTGIKSQLNNPFQPVLWDPNSYWIRIQKAFWIRIRIWKTDPDPGTGTGKKKLLYKRALVNWQVRYILQMALIRTRIQHPNQPCHNLYFFSCYNSLSVGRQQNWLVGTQSIRGLVLTLAMFPSMVLNMWARCSLVP